MPISRSRKKKKRKSIKDNHVSKKQRAIAEALGKNDDRGFLPVRVLCPNLVELIFNITPDFRSLYEFEFSNGLQDRIIYSKNRTPIRHIAMFRTIVNESILDKSQKQEIVLFENFNQYLWNLCYSLLVLFDKGIHEPRLAGIYKETFVDTPIVKQAWKVFKAGLSLRNSYDRNLFFSLPNPEINEKQEYILKSNSIYLAALNFIFLHEFGHQSYGHHRNNPSNDESKYDEHLVDEFAIDLMSDHFNSINGPTLKIGILMGALSLFFLDKGLNDGEYHPDKDIRLRVIIERLELEELSNLWGIASLALNLWMNEFQHNIIVPKSADTAKELFYKTLDSLSNFKKSKK